MERGWANSYLKALIDNIPPNIKIGDKLTFAIRYRDNEGNWTDFKEIVTINKNEL